MKHQHYSLQVEWMVCELHYHHCQGCSGVFAHAVRQVHEINGRNANLQPLQMLSLHIWKHENMFSELKKY